MNLSGICWQIRRVFFDWIYGRDYTPLKAKAGINTERTESGAQRARRRFANSAVSK